MVVNYIKKLKSKVVVALNDEKLELYPTVFASYHLYINKIIDLSELERIKFDNKVEGYFIYITNRLLKNDYSPFKIKEILKKKGANNQEVEKVLEKLEKYNFTNEEKMAENIISYCDAKHYGFNRLIKMMYNRNISSLYINKLKYDVERELNECEKQFEILSKRYKKKNFLTFKRNIYERLIRLGFEASVANEVVEKFSIYNHNNEINVLKLDYDKYFLKYSRKYTGKELEQRIIKSLQSKGYKINDIKNIKELRL